MTPSEDHAASMERIVEQAPDAIVFADTGGVIRTWNLAATEMFGFSAEEAIGQSLDIIIPLAFRDAHWAGYRRALAAGETKYRGQSLPTRAQKADGGTFYVELSFAVLRGPDGTVLGALAHARDITARFEQERANRRKLRDLEQELQGLRAATQPLSALGS